MNTTEPPVKPPSAATVYAAWRQCADKAGASTYDFNGMPEPYRNAWIMFFHLMQSKTKN